MRRLTRSVENHAVRSEDSAPSSSIDSAVRRLDDLITSYLPGLALEGKEPPEFIPPTPPITPD